MVFALLPSNIVSWMDQEHCMFLALLCPVKYAGVREEDSAGEAEARWLRLTPFSAALALSIMSAQRFEQPVVTLFSSLILEGVRHATRLRDSPWLSKAHRKVVGRDAGVPSYLIYKLSLEL